MHQSPEHKAEENIVFVSQTLVGAAGRAEEWHMDGTFKVVPSIIYLRYTSYHSSSYVREIEQPLSDSN